MKEFLVLEKLVEDGASEQAKREVMKPCQHYGGHAVKLSVTPKFHTSKYHVCDQLKFIERA